MLAKKENKLTYNEYINARYRVDSIGFGRLSENAKYIIGFSILITMIIFSLIFISALTVNASYNLVQVKYNIQKLNKENEMLKLDLASLRSPGRIQTIATTELEMATPIDVIYSSAKTKGVQVASSGIMIHE